MYLQLEILQSKTKNKTTKKQQNNKKKTKNPKTLASETMFRN
jgi:hypothetical protein